MDGTLSFRHLASDADLLAAFPLAVALRPHLKREEFVAQVRQQEADRYRVYGGFREGEIVVLAGVRDSCTLARGRHLFVDDLVTREADRGKGYGEAMLRYLAVYGRQLGISRLYLDSRDTARGFYEQLGFAFLTSIPCWIDLEALEKK